MSPAEIWIEKSHRRSLLGSRPAYDPAALQRWSGLAMGRFRVPDGITERNIYGARPIVSLLLQGEARTVVSRGAHRVEQAYRAGDLICYGGATEILRSDWRASDDALMLSVEIDPQRFTEFDWPGDHAPALAGTPRFEDPALAGLLRAMWAELEAGCPHGPLFGETLSYGVATRAFRRLATAPVRRALDAPGGLTAAQQARVEAFVQAHLAEPIGLQELADAAGLSRFHFARRFRATLGVSPYQHLLNQRAARARALLTGSTMPLAEVALACGFASQSHLSAVCRRAFGATPARLRAGA